MKRILLLTIILLFILHGISFAKIYVSEDKFDGKKAYYTTNTQEPSLFSLQGYYDIDTSFNLVQNPGNITTKNLVLTYTTQNLYYIEPTIRMKIDDIIYTWPTDYKPSLTQTALNSNVTVVWGLPDNVYTAIMNTKNDVQIRFNYYLIEGQFTKDYKLKYNYIKEVQDMYNTYGNKEQVKATQ